MSIQFEPMKTTLSHIRPWLVAVVLAGLPALGFSAPWQSITQPIGTLLIDPPESALRVNQYLMSLDPNITPATYPFDLNTDVTKIRTTQVLYFVRVYDEATGSRPVGSWIMRASQARGLTATQIRNIQALPALPTHFTLVKVPTGITLYTGVAGAIAGWGDGGATQSKLMGPPFVPRENFTNQQLIGDCFLCYRSLATEGNAHRVGAALDKAVPPAYSSLDVLYDNLDMLYFGPTADQFRQALNALSGEAVTASQQVALGNAASFTDAIREQTALWVSGWSPTKSSEPSASERPGRVWASLKGGTSMLRGDHGAAGVNASGAGVQLGLDHAMSPGMLVGVALGVNNSSYSVNDRASNGTLNGLNAAIYGVARSDNAYLSATLAYAWSDTGLSRDIQVNQLQSPQNGRFDSQVLSARLEAGYLAKLGSLNVTPFIAIEPGWLWQSGFSEKNRDPAMYPVNLGLDVRSQQINSLPGSIGVQLDAQYPLDNGWAVRPVVRLAWIHEFSPTREASASFSLLPSQTFTIYGASAPQNTARMMLGITGTHRDGLTSYLMLDANLSNRSQAYGARAGMSLRF